MVKFNADEGGQILRKNICNEKPSFKEVCAIAYNSVCHYQAEIPRNFEFCLDSGDVAIGLDSRTIRIIVLLCPEQTGQKEHVSNCRLAVRRKNYAIYDICHILQTVDFVAKTIFKHSLKEMTIERCFKIRKQKFQIYKNYQIYQIYK